MGRALELTAEQRARLIDELAAALEDMMDCTCPDMGPLWLDATRSERVWVGGAIDLPFRPSPRYLALSKGSRSKYRGLAAWRHAVTWQDALVPVDPDFRAAAEAVYFSPYPSNEPPYSWSQSAEGAPGMEKFPSASELKRWAKEGAWHAVVVLRKKAAALHEAGSWHEEVREKLVRTGCRESLTDVLKLEELPRWEDEE
jgi:hypothetical protein